MSMTDRIVEFILEKAIRFFKSKPSTYVFPLKRLNYSKNSALTSIGWNRICEHFFFHPKVELEELNMLSTMLDD